MAIVTISRECGSGGTEIGRELAKQLGYDYVDKELIFKPLEKDGKQWAQSGKNIDVSCPTIWEQFDRSFRELETLIEESIYEHAKKDNVVIKGRGGNYLLRDIPHALRIRIVAPMDVSVERVMAREKLNKEAATSLIQHTDHERSCYIHKVYHSDWSNPQDYDVLFDTSHLTFHEVIKMIVDIIPDKDKKATEKAKEKLHKLALASRVKAQIAINPYVFVPTLEVFYDGGVILVRGVIHSAKEHKLVEDIARQTAMPTQVKFELHYRGE